MAFGKVRLLIVTAATAAVSFGLGSFLGSHTAPADAAAMTQPLIVHFADAINGKLENFAPGVDFKTVATQPSAEMYATQISKVKRHSHNKSSEFFYVVSGTGSAHIGALQQTIVPGDMIFIPKGVPHSFAAGGAPLRFAEVDSPPIAENDIHWLPEK